MKRRLMRAGFTGLIMAVGLLLGVLLAIKLDASAARTLGRTVLHVSQDAPVAIDGKMVTITIGLDVQVSGISGTLRALPSTPVVVVGDGEKLVDGLGNEYVIGGDPDVAVEEWTVYEDDGDLSIAGNVRNVATDKRFSAVVAEFRFYDAKGKLVGAMNEWIGGGWIDPGQSYPFAMKRVGKIGAFARYEVKLHVRDWTTIK